ncbi:DNA topoisomerase [Trichinella spiralis]|uniref:DNA topoisomerase n=1 Tax=Trichinella spiralis TaxID=6334 RepID=A0ABR3KYS4_TRISP
MKKNILFRFLQGIVQISIHATYNYLTGDTRQVEQSHENTDKYALIDRKYSTILHSHFSTNTENTAGKWFKMNDRNIMFIL